MIKNTNEIWRCAQELFAELFRVSLLMYLALYLFEDFFEGFVISILELNAVFWAVIASCIGTVILSRDVEFVSHSEARYKKNLHFSDIIFIVVLGIVAAFLAYYRLRGFGEIAFLIAPLSGVIVIIFSLMLMMNESG